MKKAELPFDTLENSLKKLGLISKGRLSNAAVILFGCKPQRFFPNAKLRCAVFATTDTVVSLDMQDFEGDLFFLIKKAEEYVLKNIHIGMRLEGLYRVDVPEIDKKAFREAIINAFCHRNYHLYDSVNIAIFRDRVEIRSPGLLYRELTIEKIKKENVSERRNELIAEMFHKVHFVEKWGKGIRLILSKEPNTSFKEVGSQFIVTFQRKNVPENSFEGVGEKVGENEKKILKLVTENNFITYQELTREIGISEKSIYKNIEKLKQKGLLRRIGPDKGGYWELI